MGESSDWLHADTDSLTQRMLAEFADTLPRRPYLSVTKGYPIIRGKKDAALFPYVQVNPPGLVSWLIFDIDRAPGAIAWIDAGLPPPSLAVSSPPTRPWDMLGTAHLLYRLEAPIPTTTAARIKPIRYAAAVEQAMIDALGADPGYAGLLAKNPLSNAWHVRAFAQRPYTLGALAERLDLSTNRFRGREKSRGLGRNCDLFDSLRFWAYATKGRFVSFEAFFAAVLEQAAAFNLFPVPLPLSEVRATAKSIAKWTWANYDGSGRSRKNRGVLQLTTTEIPLVEKQALGGRHTAALRGGNTADRLRAAWHRLKAITDSPTQVAVARDAGVSLRTAKRYWRRLQDAIHQPQ